MSGTKYFFSLFIFPVFFIAVAFTAGCSSPIGSLLIDSGSTIDFIRVEPKRFVYSDEDDLFIPVDDMDVFGIFRGIERPIAIEDVEIIISEYPFPTEDKVIVLDELDKEFGIQLDSGRKNIVISYSGKETLYRISVGETETGDGGGNGGGGTGGTEIGWVW